MYEGKLTVKHFSPFPRCRSLFSHSNRVLECFDLELSPSLHELQLFFVAICRLESTRLHAVCNANRKISSFFSHFVSINGIKKLKERTERTTTKPGDEAQKKLLVKRSGFRKKTRPNDTEEIKSIFPLFAFVFASALSWLASFFFLPLSTMFLIGK